MRQSKWNKKGWYVGGEYFIQSGQKCAIDKVTFEQRHELSASLHLVDQRKSIPGGRSGKFKPFEVRPWIPFKYFQCCGATRHITEVKSLPELWNSKTWIRCYISAIDKLLKISEPFFSLL